MIEPYTGRGREAQLPPPRCRSAWCRSTTGMSRSTSTAPGSRRTSSRCRPRSRCSRSPSTRACWWCRTRRPRARASRSWPPPWPALGEKAAFDWWARMRANGLGVAKGWTEAYYTEFSQKRRQVPDRRQLRHEPGGRGLLQQGQAHRAADRGAEPERAACFRQVEGVALLKGGRRARGRPAAFIEFLRSAPVQQALQTTLWMLPAEPGTPRGPPRFASPRRPAALRQPDAAGRWPSVRQAGSADGPAWCSSSRHAAARRPAGGGVAAPRWGRPWRTRSRSRRWPFSP